MVKYGPAEVFQCIHCDEKIEHRGILEVNGRHTVVWSDGYFDSPSAPEPPLVVKCPCCKQVLWLPEVEFISSSEERGVEYERLTEGDYWRLLSHYESSISEHLLYLRLKCWQLSNHPYRELQTQERFLSELECSNLEGVLALVDTDSVRECNIAVEVLRHLGRFDEALALMEKLFHRLEPEIISVQRSLIEEKSTRLFSCSFRGERMVVSV